MFCVALTGNIASGKSTVASLFADLGIEVINADQISRNLTAPDQPALQKIINHFGRDILTESESLNRKALRKIIFNNPNERAWLENLLHPLIRQEIKKKVKEAKGPYCIIEIPLLPDRTNYPYLNRILYIKADKEQQIKRLEKRDQMSKEEALKILAAQASEDKHLAFADDVLKNEGTMAELRMQIINLHARYLQFAKHNTA